MSREADIAWAAGFFEGEGCFSLTRQFRKDGSFSVAGHVNVWQKGENGKLLLEKFCRIVGCGKVAHKPSRDMWRWDTSKQKDFVFIRDLFKEWLSPRRLERSQEILSIREEHRRVS